MCPHISVFGLFVRMGVPVVHVHDFICMYVGVTWWSIQICYCYAAKKYLTLPTPCAITETFSQSALQANDLNEDFMRCEGKGQQQGADPDAPWCSTGDLGVCTKQSLEGELQAAEVSGNTAELQHLCGVRRSYRRSTWERKEGRLITNAT